MLIKTKSGTQTTHTARLHFAVLCTVFNFFFFLNSFFFFDIFLRDEKDIQTYRQADTCTAVWILPLLPPSPPSLEVLRHGHGSDGGWCLVGWRISSHRFKSLHDCHLTAQVVVKTSGVGRHFSPSSSSSFSSLPDRHTYIPTYTITRRCAGHYHSLAHSFSHSVISLDLTEHTLICLDRFVFFLSRLFLFFYFCLFG